MELITKKMVIEGVPKRYAAQYPKNYMFRNGTESRKILAKLKAAVPLTEQSVKEIIGNASWTELSCDECDESVDAVIVLGQEPDFESKTARICIECLKKAMTHFSE